MLVARIYVSKTEVRAEKVTAITSGLVGAEVDVYFDRSWDGYAKTYVWEHNGTTIDDTKCSGVIPHEVVAESGGHLRFGVYGTKNGTKVTPTLWCNVDTVRNGADPAGDESTDPTLPVWAQIRDMIGNLDDLDTEAKENLVAAVNEALTKGADRKEIEKIVSDYLETLDIVGQPGEPGEDGGYYTPGVTQPDNETLQFDFAPSKAGMEEVEPVRVKLPVPDSTQNGNGLTTTEKNLILSLFKNAAYTADMSATIAELEALWSGSGGDDTGGSGEGDSGEDTESVISQTGSVLTISGVADITTITQSGTVLTMA